MSQNLDRLISQTLKLIPQFSNCIQKIPANNFMINYPLELIQQKSKCIFPNSDLFLKSLGTIRANNHVFFIDGNEFFASSNFSGATNAQDERLSQKLFQLKEKYEIFDADMINRIKLTLSVQANSFDPDLPLNQYAKYILKHSKNPSIQNYIKNHANSGFLKSVLNSNKLAINTAYEYLHKSFMKMIKEDSFGSAYEIVRFYSKQTNKLRVIFPFCNNIKHSFEPNCQLKALFLTHRRQTFLTLSTLREIQPGENLTVNYGNQNNYELFVRYGFTIPNNPFSEFYLPVDFSDIEEIFNANIDWKMEIFKKNKNFKLKNFIRINSKGNIHPDDFNMLKIIFSTQALERDDFLQDNEVSKKNSKQINEFVKKTAQRFTIIMERIEKKKKQLGVIQTKKPQNETEEAIAHNINVIESQEKQILKNLIQKN